MQLHLPDAIAIWKQLLGPARCQAQLSGLTQSRCWSGLPRQLRSSCRQPQQPGDDKSDNSQRGQHFNQH